MFAEVSSALDKYHGFPISDANKQRRNQNRNLEKINMALDLMKATMKSKLLLVLELNIPVLDLHKHENDIFKIS